MVLISFENLEIQYSPKRALLNSMIARKNILVLSDSSTIKINGNLRKDLTADVACLRGVC